MKLTEQERTLFRDGMNLVSIALAKLRAIAPEVEERLSARGREYVQEVTIALETAALRFKGE